MRRRQRCPGERGQTAAEFALVAPVLLVIVVAAIQMGILYNNYVTLTDAVRAGARRAAVGRHLANPAAEAEATVRAKADNLTQSSLQVIVTAPGGWQVGSDVVVEARYPYSVNLLGLVVRSGLLASRTTERVE
jgi:Flp pilus assembly protein TadG